MATRIQVRRDLAANWTGSLVLASGEVAYETDTGNVKIGDGSTTWTNLDYIAIANRSSVATDINDTTYRVMGRFYLDTTTGTWTNLPTDMTAADGDSLLLVTRHMDGASAWFYQHLIQFVTSGNETKEWVRAYSAGSSSWSAWRSTAHISPNEVVTASINNLAVTTAKIDDLAVTTIKIADNNVTNAKIRDSAALSVIGRSANSTGDPADIAASNDGEVLRRSGTALGFGTLASAAFADNTIAPARLTSATGATVLGATGAGAISQLSAANGRTALGLGTIATETAANYLAQLNQVGGIVIMEIPVNSGNSLSGVYTGITSSSTTLNCGSSGAVIGLTPLQGWAKSGNTLVPTSGTWSVLINRSTATDYHAFCIRTA
jgi:hypothetical protein